MPGWILSWELLILLVVVLLVFGPKPLHVMGRSLGKGLRVFKYSVSGNDDDDRDRRAELPVETQDTKADGAPRERQDTTIP
jgi:sec-independent protein translocase protein TatA